MDPTILSSARFVALIAKWGSLSQTRCGEPVRGDAQLDELLLNLISTPVSQAEVVFICTSVVASTFDAHVCTGKSREYLGQNRLVPGKFVERILADVAPVVLEVDVLERRSQVLERWLRLWRG
jgi:hypothetical protein